MEYSYNVTILSILRRKNFNQSERTIDPSIHVEFLNGMKINQNVENHQNYILTKSGSIWSNSFVRKEKVMDDRQWTQTYNNVSLDPMGQMI